MTVLEAIDGARLSEITATETSLRRFLYGLPGGRPGRRGVPGRNACHPVDQDHREANGN